MLLEFLKKSSRKLSKDFLLKFSLLWNQNSYKIPSGNLPGPFSGIIQRTSPYFFPRTNPGKFSGVSPANLLQFYADFFPRFCPRFFPVLFTTLFQGLHSQIFIGSHQNSPKGLIRIFFLNSCQIFLRKSSRISLRILPRIPTGVCYDPSWNSSKKSFRSSFLNS